MWAAEHRAVVISTYAEFSQRRMRNAIGRHVWLRCSDWEANAVLADHLAEVLTLLEARNDLEPRAGVLGPQAAQLLAGSAPVGQVTIGRQPGQNGHHGGIEVAGQALRVAQHLEVAW